MVDLTQIASLDPAQLELLRRRLQKATKREEGRIPRILPQGREAVAFPLSFAQRRLWFSDRLAPGNPAYNVGILTRMAGALERAVFLRAVGEVFRRHEILRTRYAFVDREPMQVIDPEVRVDLPLVDLEALPAERREPEALRRAADSALRPFDLERGPLFRTEAFRLAPDEHLLLVSFHHIVSDGWSFGLFVRELAKLYEAFFHGRPSPLPDLAVQYADFAVWQRRWLEGSPLVQEQLAWWKERLEGAPPALELPADRPRPAALGHHGRREHRVVPRALEHRIEALAEAHDVTPFMVQLLAFQVLLHRYTGQPDIVVGSPVASRNRSEIEELIGFFANSLVLRTGFAGRPSFRDLLPQMRETVLGAFAHQDLPFETLVEELRPERDLSHQPVFQVMFALQNFQLAPQSLPGLEMIPLDWDLGMSHFDMTLFITPEPGRLLATLRYNQDLFDATTARRMLEHLEALLEAVADDPGRPVATVGFLREAERHQLAEWSTAAGFQVLDSEGAPVPAGVAGRVWRDDRETAELARFRADGAPELLGRADAQIRVRGFRVDARQVEERLSAHPAVREAAVAAVDGRLVAYLAASPEAGLDPRGILGRELPDYMVPSAFVVLNVLPRTASGEVDMALLPAPSSAEAPGRRPRSRSVRFTPFAAPRTPVEESLVGIFREVLELDEVGIHDSFFELGGHSLLGTVLMSRVRDAFGSDLPLLRLFETPTVEGLGQLLAGQEGRQAVDAEDRIVRTAAPSHPLSFPQQGLWFLDQFEAESPAYNIPMSVRLAGDLDLLVLEASFNEIVRRHDALRTSFATAEGAAVQRVAPFTPFSVPVIDLSQIAEGPGRDELARLAAEEVQRLFDLTRGPLYRIQLVRLAAREHVSLLTFHHIVFDGWSMGVLLREFAALYTAFSTGRPSPLPELPIQYADYAHWQRQRLQGEALEELLAYWRRQLGGPLPVLELPADRPRRAQAWFRGRHRWMSLSPDLVAALREFGERNGVTLFMVFLAAFQVWLCRHSGQEDLLVGAPIANRRRSEVEGLIGLFLNTLTLRTDLTGDPPFPELLRRVQKVTLEAYANQDAPFEAVVEAIGAERTLGRSPVFQVMLMFLNAPSGALELPGLRLIPLEVDSGTSKFDLTLFLWEAEGTLRGGVEYNSELFEAVTLERMVRRFEVLLQGVLQAPEARLWSLPLLPEAEAAQLRYEANDGRRWPAEPCIHEQVAARAALAPDAVAVVDGGLQLTYRELAARAGRLAGWLRRVHGVGPETPVGVFLDRSADLVTTLLGVLQAGGAYLPLDPAYPQERLGYILRDAAAPVLLTRQSLLGSLPDLSGDLRVACLDREDLGADTTTGLAGPENLAYVIYTSGSTGAPKGTRICHHNVARLFAATQPWFGFGVDDVWTLFHSSAFDFSVWEIWGALTTGGRLVVVPHLVSRSPEVFHRLLADEGVTVLNQTPSAFYQLVRADAEVPQNGLALRWVVFGGEALDLQGLAPWFARHGDQRPRLINMYGITETTVHVTYRPVGEADLRTAHRSPIGRPIPDLQVHVLDPAGGLAPLGVPGEICVGGEGVCGGYLGRPELSAERFVPDPFGGTPGGRLYRSGDLARRLAGGDLDYLGRIDQQVKVRGFRIELGEIEAVLAAHPAVEQAVVLSRKQGDDHRLVAYMVQDFDHTEAVDPAEERLDDRVSQWTTVFDGSYGTEAPDGDATFNLSGWNSSYTGRRIPDAEMREWLEDTIASLLALRPRRVLEIGFGTGMLLFRLAPQAERYRATDISQEALRLVREQLDRAGGAPQVELLLAAGDDFGWTERDGFDTAVLNSVSQYFPSVDYLARVLEAMVESVRPSGAVFVGDLRSLPLWEAFQTSVELHQAEPSLPLEQLRQRVRARMRQERELLVDPAFFAALQARLPKIGRVRIFPKRGHFHNELTAFRYQVVLEIGETAAPRAEAVWVDWQREGLSLETLRQRLLDERPEVLCLANIPNARVAEAAQAVWLLRERGGISSLEELRRKAAEGAAVEPENLWALAGSTPYRVDLGWSRPGPEGRLEAVLRREDAGDVDPWALLAAKPDSLLPWQAYANDPMRGAKPAPSAERLRAFLRERLPEYMVPAALLWVEELPLTPHGKVDRKALASLEAVAAQREERYEAPRTRTEARLVELWAEVLGIEGIGIRDNFFDLGGHSLLATQLISRVNRTFDASLPLRVVFEAATVAEMAAHVESAAGTPSEELEPPIERVPRDGRLPLSFAQQRIWFFDRWEPGSAVFNVSTAVELDGELRLALLEATLDEAARRHETLRTRFADFDGEPVQVIDPPRRRRIPVVDLEGLPEAAREAEAGRLAREEARRAFDLERGPLLRATLLRSGGRRHLALLTMHHILSDGWSMAILTGEIGEVYRALAAGRPSPLPELPLQYVDFAAWQRRWLQGPVLERQMGYWKERLEGAPDSLSLPVDRPRSAVQRYRGRRLAARFPRALADGLKTLARQQEGTLFMALVASFKALLLRYTHQTDLLLGTLIANRNRRETEGLIGCFANALVLRTEVTAGLSFRQALARVREVTLGAYAHQDMPFEKLIEELNPDRQMSLTPLFQAMFILQNTPRTELEIPGLRLNAWEVERDTVNYDLFLSLYESDEGITGNLDYDAELFDGATVRRLLGHWEAMIAAAVEAPDRPLAEAPLLAPAERHHLLVEWNDSHRGEEAGTVLDLFDARAARTPDAVAAVCGADRLLYRELHERCGRLARSLTAQGVVRGQVVPLLAGRGLDFLTAVLALFRCGAAYLPLDPVHPAPRIAQILADAGAPLALADRTHLPRIEEASGLLPAGDRPALRALEDLLDGEARAALPAGPPAPQDLAYVLFTSGSTGRPKGVMVEHRGMLNHLWAKIVELGLSECDRVAQNASQCFDISVWQLLASPASGGAVHILSDEIAHDPWRLLQEVDRVGITVLEVVPSLLRMMLEEAGRPGARPALSTLRWLVPTGEALPSHLCREWLAQYPRIPLLNAYGPTECSDDVSHMPIARPGEAGEPVAPIGRPLLNTRLYVLDPDLAPVPAGVSGELLVGGAGVGRGYLREGARTARAFVPDGLSGAAGERLYRTGDLARFLADGRIEFLGRLDHQVKVRGFRIELGEIESVLRHHPAVREAVVVARRDGADVRLVAYVTQETDEVDAGADAEWQSEQVSQWASVFDDFYIAEATPEDPTFNIAAWDSSYTGGRIPEEEMREWLADTVERIRGLRPRRILELGCGTGMLLFRLAPDCERYLGTDIAAEGIAYLRRLLGAGLPQVELRQRAADDFAGVETDAFDAVLINSVAQYFPSIDYLVQVLTGAVDAVAPGGFIFLGDIRSLPLLEAFHTSVELFRADDSLPVEQVRQNVRLQMRQETELVVDPAFFLALPRYLPKIGAVEIHPKRGRLHNELSRFRYQVVLRVGPAPAAPAASAAVWSDWQQEGLDLASLRRRLLEEQPERLCLRNVPNARVAPSAAAVWLMAEDASITTVGELRAALARIPAGIDPQDLWDLGGETGYEVDLGWSRPGAQGTLEVVFQCGTPLYMPPVLDEEPVLQRWSRYANNPLQGKFASQVVPRLRGYLGERLPDYMVPSAFVLLDALPLTRNGKLDYRALPAPEVSRPDLDDRFVPPRTAVEIRMAEIWQDVLGLRRVGAEDNFFEIGGHSLLATQVMSRLRAGFGVEVPLRELFEAPTVRGLAQRIETALEAARRVETAIPAAPAGETPILSFAQERLWFLDQLESESSVYNLPAAVRCSGRLDLPVLERTHEEIVRRHETLRSAFPAVDGQARLVVQPARPLRIPLVDLGALPEGARDRERRRLMNAEANRPFDLSRGPLLRVQVLRLQPEEHILLATMHHIASDAWSMWVFVQEVAAVYGAFVRGLPSPLLELALQYRDFARWQRGVLEGTRLEELLAYWRDRLGDHREVLALPTDRPRPPVQTARGGLQTVTLPDGLCAALHELGQKENVTLFMALLAGFKTLLYRYTGQQDLAVGSLIANRNRVEIERLIGCFINTLVLRTKLQGGAPFRGLLAAVREVTLDAYAHPDLPFEKLVEELRPERDLSHPPLCQVLLVFQNTPAQTLDLPGLTLGMVVPEHAASPFDMAWYFEERQGGLFGTAEYNLDLFDAATVHRMLRQLEAVLGDTLRDPGRPLDELSLLPPSERFQLAAEWNDTWMDYPDDVCIHRLVERAAADHADEAAVFAAGAPLPYRELDARANRLARHLRGLGVGPETVVGLCMKRSAEMVVAILGVLKAGGAYLPLDPSYPRERLELFLRDSGAPLLVIHGRDPGLALERGVRTVCLERDRETIGHQEDSVLPPLAGPESPAYVIYTSGSTGRPKGVVVTHRNLVHSTCARGSFYREPVAGYLLASSFAFDSSVAGLFWTLCAGGTLVLPAEEPQLDLPGFLALFDARRVSHLLCLPALYRALLEQDEAGRLATLRTVIVAGEACPPDLIALHRERRPGTALFNEYGPTECSVWSTVAELGHGLAGPQVPIGRPIARAVVHLLDRRLHAVPVGAFGELYVGGEGLARGYLGAPAATAERFLPDPFAAAPGARLYRTGDLARWLPDGQLEFAGRADQQVKIRGFRIELGEVERALERHPLVAEAVAVAWQEPPGPARLIGYVAGRDGGSPDPAALQGFLRGVLPEYMVPAVVTVLPALPRTPNGKVDRNALPRPQGQRPGLKTPYAPPRTPVETALAGLWEQVLRLDRVGIDDGFSELGGDSILGLQIVGRAGRSGYRFLLKHLFERQTVRSLAQAVEIAPAPGAAASSGAVAGNAYPLSPLQQGLLFHTLYAPGSDQYLVETLFALEEPLDLAALGAAWRRVVERHTALRTRFAWEGLEEPLQIVEPWMDAALDLVDASALPLEKREELLDDGLRSGRRGRTPDPAVGRPARLTVFRLGDASFRLLFSYHHLALDGWSTSRVIGELWTLYRAARAGRGDDLPAAPPFRRYVDWLRQQDLAAAERHWRGLLQGFAAPTALSADRGGLPGDGAEHAEEGVRLPAALTAELADLARRERLTLSTLVQSAWSLLLARRSGTSDVVFGLTSAGRPPELPDVEEMVGVLITTVPVRAEVDEAAPLLPWLRRLHAQRLESQPYEHAPLVQIQRWSEIGAGSPLFEYLYVFGNYPESREASQGGLRQVRSFDRTNYPLSLEVEPGPGLGLRLVYDRRRFDAVDVLKLLADLHGLLAGIAEAPERELGDLPALSAAERHQLVLEWSDTHRDGSPGEPGLVELFAAQTARTPGAVAVRCGAERLTYAELDARSSAMAAALTRLGVGLDVLVALLCHRGIDFLATVLAVFKAGGAYLPLDPHHPLERTLQILAQAHPHRVLAARELAQGLGEVVEIENLPVSGEAAVPPPVRPSNLAYVIYTSGSTGVPKGAMVEHRGMVNHLWAKIEDLALTGSDVVAQTASQCFDISVWQLLAALLVGGRVHVFPDEVTRDPARLLDEVEAAGVTVFETVPSLLRLMTDEVESRAASRPALAAMRWLIPTGEALLPEDCRRWLRSYPDMTLLNAYGPTECSDDVAHWPIQGLPEEAPAIVPIGRAIRNTRLYVLDDRMRPSATGVPGELHVGGDGVGRGYRGDGARTAAVFVPDPFSEVPGGRLYKTGDRARFRADGSLEFLGRIDDQVKIRGFRIELGEIEAALRDVPGVRQAVVVDREVAPGDRRLVAYVVGERRTVPGAEELRNLLKSRLPEYMVPSAFVALEALPLTRNGKVDRKALPSPAAAPERDGARVAPRSEAEQKIAAVWCEVLRLDAVGVEENFFDLGGHSLLIVQVYSRLRKVFDTDLTVVDMFKYPTVSGLAARLTRAREEADSIGDRFARGGQRRETSGRRRQLVQQKRQERQKQGSTDDLRS